MDNTKCIVDDITVLNFKREINRPFANGLKVLEILVTSK